MRKFRGIVQTVVEPKDENILWYNKGELLFFNNGEWQPFLDINKLLKNCNCCKNMTKEEVKEIFKECIDEFIDIYDIKKTLYIDLDDSINIYDADSKDLNELSGSFIDVWNKGEFDPDKYNIVLRFNDENAILNTFSYNKPIKQLNLHYIGMISANEANAANPKYITVQILDNKITIKGKTLEYEKV